MNYTNLLVRHTSMALGQGKIALLTMKVFTTLCRRMILLVRPLGAPIPDHRPRLPVDIKILTDEDLPAYSRFQPKQAASLIQTRLTHGEQCFTVWHEGRIAHAARVATERVYIPYLHRDLVLQPGDVYSHSSFTLPAYRSYGLSLARTVYAMHHYRQAGYRRMVVLVTVENTNGLHVVKQELGYQDVGLYGCLRFGPWQYSWQRMWGDEPLPVLTNA
jgi:hypothetical protein